jgi:hypothetical protein
MIPATKKSKFNKIIEAANALVGRVVLSIIDDPPAPGVRQYPFNPLWASQYESIKDLNIVGPDSFTHLIDSPEFSDRRPAAAFFIDEVKPDGPLDNECYIGSLGLAIMVEGETMAIAQLELFEIFYSIRQALYSDRSLGHITERGGIIDDLVWSSMEGIEFATVGPGVHLMTGIFFFNIYFREMLYFPGEQVAS